MENHTISDTESKHNPPVGQRRFRHLVQNIYLSGRADWEYPGEQAFIEQELDRLTEDGSEILSLLKDRDGDIEVILKVAVEEGPGQ